MEMMCSSVNLLNAMFEEEVHKTLGGYGAGTKTRDRKNR